MEAIFQQRKHSAQEKHETSFTTYAKALLEIPDREAVKIIAIILFPLCHGLRLIGAHIFLSRIMKINFVDIYKNYKLCILN